MTLHVGRSWPGSDNPIEKECPCHQLPCGLVDFAEANRIGCPQHSIAAGKTIRQSHDARECPGRFKKPLETP